MKMPTTMATLAALLITASPMVALAATAPNVVLVHGAFAGAPSWDKVADLRAATEQ